MGAKSAGRHQKVPNGNTWKSKGIWSGLVLVYVTTSYKRLSNEPVFSSGSLKGKRKLQFSEVH